MKKELSIYIGGRDNLITLSSFTPYTSEDEYKLDDDKRLYDKVNNGNQRDFFTACLHNVEFYLDDEFIDAEFFNSHEMTESISELRNGWCIDEEEFEEEAKYLTGIQFGECKGIVNNAIKSVWKKAATPGVVYSHNILNAIIRESLGEDATKVGVWVVKVDAEEPWTGDEDDIEQIVVRFKIDVEDEFDLSKLTLLKFDEAFKPEILKGALDKEVALLNVIIYDGKMYFLEEGEIQTIGSDFNDCNGEIIDISDL